MQSTEKTFIPADPVKDEIIQLLSGVYREGIEDLLEYMDDVGFFTAPASTEFHGSEAGGLEIHSLNVYRTAMKLADALIGEHFFGESMQDSITIVSLLHDIGKCGDFGKPLYIPNMVQDGKPTKANPEQKYKQSDKKPWKRNTRLLPVDHATRSIKLITLFLDLTEDEEFAIRYHDGLYEAANYAVKGHETWLYMILHWADMWSSRVIEDNNEESEE